MAVLLPKQQLYKLQQNQWFEILVIGIIVFSALITGIKTYNIDSSMFNAVAWLDIFITLFFLVEILIRFAAEPRFLDFFKSGWNVFDFVIVTVSLLPLEGSDSVLLARLLRIFRVLRLISVIPELRLLINTLIKSLPRMGYIVLLMFIIFYIYAAIGSVMFSHINPTLWGNISIAMLTLFRVATFEDWTDVMYETMSEFPLSWIFYLSFIFFTAFVFLNMMIGVVLDVMQREQSEFHRESGEAESGAPHWARDYTQEMEQRLGRIESLLLETVKDDTKENSAQSDTK
jgi:voltage-gated sodium channel